MRVDSHMHTNFNGFTCDSIVDYLNRNSFDKCWLMTWEEVNPGGWPYQHLSVEDMFDRSLRHKEQELAISSVY